MNIDKLKAKVKKGLARGAASIAGGSTTRSFAGSGHKLGSGDGQPASTSGTAAPQQRASNPAAQRPRPPPPAPRPEPRDAPSDALASLSLGARSPRPAAAPAATAPPPAEDASEEVQAAVAQLAADPNAAAAAAVLRRLLGNVLSSPSDERFRRVRLTNPKIQAAVVDSSGGVELLLACGFEIVFEAAAAGGGEGGAGEEEGYAVLPAGQALGAVRAAAAALASLLPPPAAPAPAPAPHAAATPRAPPREREWEAPRERGTRVILPASLDADLPPWFFERTGADLKAEFRAAAARREAAQQLTTAAARARARSGGGPPPRHAWVKVRLPEGLAVQAEFGAGEPAAAVFGWLAGALRGSGLHTYELVLPDRQVLSPGSKAGRPQSVREAGLLPAVTLNLRWTGASAAEMARQPALREELLRAAARGEAWQEG